MMIPTSASTAIMVDLWPWLGDLLSYLVPAIVFAGVFCAWKMLLSTLVGRRPSRSRWLVLLASGGLMALAVLAENVLMVDATFNGDTETYWGFVLSPWLMLAATGCAAALVALRIIDARRLGSFAGVPGVAWWGAGCLVVSAYGVAMAWMSWGAMASAAYLTAYLSAGFALAIAGAGSLIAAALLRWRRHEATA